MYVIIDYIDDYLGIGFPSMGQAFYVLLLDLMAELSLTVSEKKLVAPSMQVAC